MSISKIQTTSFKDLIKNQVLVIGFVLCVFLFQSVRLVELVNKYAVNLIFWDQFDFLKPLFMNLPAWSLFRWQHGPHRQGAGAILIRIVADLSGWNGRADSFFILGLVIISCILVLGLKRILFRKFALTDIFLPLIVLNIYQWETFIGVPNIALAGLPLLLVFCYSFSWFIKNIYLRYCTVLLINFLLIFTGFGIFMGLMTMGVLILDMILLFRAQEKKQIILAAGAFLISVLSFAYYYQGYVFLPAVDCFAINSQNLSRLPVFWSLMVSLFFALHYGYEPKAVLVAMVGAVVLFVLVFTFCKHLLRYLKGPDRGNLTSKIILLLIGFTLLFSGSASIGRVCTGYQGAQAHRYMTLLIPGMVGLFFDFSTIKNRWVSLETFFVVLILIGKSALPLPPGERTVILQTYEGKTAWKTCYLASENYDACNQRTGFKIYPTANPRILNELNYLKREHLNLYLDVPSTRNQ